MQDGTRAQEVAGAADVQSSVANIPDGFSMEAISARAAGIELLQVYEVCSQLLDYVAVFDAIDPAVLSDTKVQ